MGKPFYLVQRAENAADIYIFGDIVTERWFAEETSGSSLVDELKQLGEVDRINVHIDSYGGSVSEGWAIYNALKQHPAKVVTYADGFVASAALYPFLAGDERHASTLSAFYLHEVMSWGEGYAEDLRKAADEAETMTDIGIGVFVERTDMDAETVKSLMEAETWLTPAQALEYGIATSVDADKREKTQQSARRQMLRQFFAAERPAAEPEMKTEEKNEQTASIMQAFAKMI